jgi:hypothetical protein
MRRLSIPRRTGFAGLGALARTLVQEGRGQRTGIFDGNPALAYVMLRVSEQDVGVTIPARACGAAGGGGGHLSCGDRASLPGRSTRYRIVWLVCAQCGSRVAWLFYDERDIPVCVNSPHGRLELQR